MNATDESVPPPFSPPPPGTGDPAADPPPTAARRLTRSTDDKVIAGLGGGLGRHFGIDPVVFRIAFVVLALAGGTGVLLYLVGWLLVQDDQGNGPGFERLTSTRPGKLALAVGIGVGLLMLVDDNGPSWRHLPLALGLIAIGAAVLVSRRSDQGRSGTVPPHAGPPPAGPQPAGTRPAGSQAPGAGLVPLATTTPAPRTDDPTTEITAPPALTAPPASPAPPVPPAAPARPSAPPRPRVPKPARPSKPRSVLVPMTLSLLAILSGVFVLAQVRVAIALAILLLATSAALLTGAWRGRARWLIPIALLLAGAMSVASVLDVPINGEVGGRRFVPAGIAEIRDTYRLGIGQLDLDFTHVDFSGQTATVLASSGIGQLRVTVPPGVEVVVTGHAGAGNVDLFNRGSDGTHVDRRTVSPGIEGGGRLVLRARVGIGQVVVRRA